MAKMALPLLTGGLNDVARSDLIDNSQLQECLNYEITGDGVLRRRTEPEEFDAELNALLSALFTDVISISEPYYFVTDIDLANSPYTLKSDYVILAFGLAVDGVSYEMHSLYKIDGGDGWTNAAQYASDGTETPLNDLLTDSKIAYTELSDVQFVISTDRVIITDNVNNAHFVTVDVDGLFRAGKLGMPAPTNKARVERLTEWNDDLFEETSTDSRLSQLGLFQCVYTVVTKSGDESNPSPLSDTLDMQFFKLSANSADERWLDKVTINDLSVPDVSENDLEDLKYFKVYMRVIRYSEGVEMQTLDFTEQFEIINKSAKSGSTGNSYELKVEIDPGNMVSYENDVAPIAKTAASLGGITMLGNVQTKIRFPHDFKYYHPITIDNKDSKHYVDAVVKLRLWDKNSGDSDAIENFVVSDFFSLMPTVGIDNMQNTQHLRLFDEDLTTPIMVAWEQKAAETELTNFEEEVPVAVVDLFVKIPLLAAASKHIVYLCWTDLGNMDDYDGVPNEYNGHINNDTTWFGNIGIHYGKVMQIGANSWDRQQVWSNSRVKESSFIVSPVEFNDDDDYALNKANGGINGYLNNVETRTTHEAWSGVSQLQVVTLSGREIGTTVFKSGSGAGKHNLGGGYINYNFLQPENGTATASAVDFTKGFYSATIVFMPSLIASGAGQGLTQIFYLGNNSDSDSKHIELVLSAYGDTGKNIESNPIDWFLRLYVPGLDTDVGWNFPIEGFPQYARNDNTNHKYDLFCSWDFSIPEVTVAFYDMQKDFVETGSNKGIFSSTIDGHIYGTNYFTALDNMGSFLINYPYSSENIYNDNMELGKGEYISDMYRILQQWNFQPMYDNVIGYDFGKSIGSGDDYTYNNNVEFGETEEVEYKSNRNMLKWTDVNGMGFPDLYFKKVKEPILKIMPAPSFLQFQYQNTFIVFTRNSINRFVLEGSASGWSGSSSSLIEEKKQYGLLAEKSLVRVGDALFWLSEAGVVKWIKDGLSLISKNVINVDYDTGVHGYYVPLKDQYVLQTLETSYPTLYRVTGELANVAKASFLFVDNSSHPDIDYVYIAPIIDAAYEEAFKADGTPMFEIGDVIKVTKTTTDPVTLETTSKSELMKILQRPNTAQGHFYTVRRAYEGSDKVVHSQFFSFVALANVSHSYVYHIDRGVWTKFDNLDTKQAITLTGGSQRENVNLFLNKKVPPTIDLYPTDSYTTADSNIKTKEMFFEKGTLKRIKANYGGTVGVKQLQSTVKTLNNIDKNHEVFANSEEWRGVPLNVCRGKSVSFQIHNANTIKTIMYDLDIESEVKV